MMGDSSLNESTRVFRSAVRVPNPYVEGLNRDYRRLAKSFVATFDLRPDYTQSVFPGEWSGVILTRSLGTPRKVTQGVEIKSLAFDLLFHVGTRDWPGGLDILSEIDHRLGDWIANCEPTEFLRNLELDERPLECAASQLLVDPHTWRLDVTATATANFAIRRQIGGNYLPL